MMNMTGDMTASEKLSLVKSIILATRSLKLFGCLIYKFDIKLVDAPFTAMVTTSIPAKDESNKKDFDRILTMLFSKEFVETKSATDLVYIMLHEETHVLNNHLSRGVGRKSELFNIATDHVINLALDKDVNSGYFKGVTSPSDRIIINVLKDENMSADEVYNYLLEHATTETQTFEIDLDSDSGSGNDSSSSENDSGEEPEDGSEDESGNESEDGSENDSDKESQNGSDKESEQPSSGNKRTIEVKKTKVKLDDGQEFEFYEDIKFEKETEKLEKELQADTRRLLNSPVFNDAEKTRGSGSSNTLELIKEAIQVEIPWDDILEDVIKTSITEISDNKTWKRVNKRMYQHGLILPYNDMEETYDTLYIIVDTSGSVSTTELQKFVHIIKAAMYHFKIVVKLDHDSRIYDKHKKVYEQQNINELLTDLKVEFTGRGGTSHKDVYDYLELIHESDDPDPGLILFLTDYESDVEYIHDNYKWHHEIPYKFIISNNHKIPVSEKIDKQPIYILPND